LALRLKPAKATFDYRLFTSANQGKKGIILGMGKDKGTEAQRNKGAEGQFFNFQCPISK
jgi:hypothetical protein